jgi:hypothetical protein
VQPEVLCSPRGWETAQDQMVSGFNPLRPRWDLWRIRGPWSSSCSCCQRKFPKLQSPPSLWSSTPIPGIFLKKNLLFIAIIYYLLIIERQKTVVKPCLFLNKGEQSCFTKMFLSILSTKYNPSWVNNTLGVLIIVLISFFVKSKIFRYQSEALGAPLAAAASPTYGAQPQYQGSF